MNYIDGLIRIQNASMRNKIKTELLYSKIMINILYKLKQEDRIASFKVVKDNDSIFQKIIVFLSYNYENNAIKTRKFNKVTFISKPGRRLYITYKKLKKTYGGYGFTLLSTSKGILTGKESKFQKIGGELLAEIY